MHAALRRVFWFVFSPSFMFARVSSTFDSFLNSLFYSFFIIHLFLRLYLVFNLLRMLVSVSGQEFVRALLRKTVLNVFDYVESMD